MSAAEHASGFARALLGGREAALSASNVTLWTLPDQRTRWYAAGNPDAIASAAVRLSEQSGNEAVYIGVGVSDKVGGPDQRPKAYPEALDDVPVTGLLAVAADIDFSGPAHISKKAYPPGPDEARQIVAGVQLPPTLEVLSGHGIQMWWVFTEPYIFGQVDQDTDGTPIIDRDRYEQDRREAMDLFWSWVTTLRVHAKVLGGWDIDPTTDIARVLRMPGSVNRKIRDQHRPVKLDVTRPQTYNPDDLVPYLADPETLKTYRMAGRAEVAGALEGVDVHAVWARVHSRVYAAQRFLPRWLATLFALDEELDGRLSKTFHGQRVDLGGDQNVIDASLARQLADLDASAEQICEAIMCRRLRYGEKVAKIDPRRRVDYLARTVGRFIAESRRSREAVELRQAAAMESAGRAAEVATSVTDGPVEMGVVRDEPPASDAEAEEGDPPAPAPAQQWAWLEGGHSAERPSAAIRPEANKALAALTGMLALPDDYTVAAVQFRRGLKRDEMRLWVHRGVGAGDPPGIHDWKVDTLRVTRWHTKSSWEKPGEVTAHLLHDLHLVCGKPIKDWRNTGLPLMYSLLSEVQVGTPLAALRAAIRDLLLSHPPIVSFGEARDNGHCWLLRQDPGRPPVVGVPLPTLRRHMAQMGESGPLPAEEIVTMAAAMGCEVRVGVTVREHFRDVRDSRTWIVVAQSVLTSGDWSAVSQAIADYGERMNRANVHPIRKGVAG